MVSVPLLLVSGWVISFRLGSELSSLDSELWDQMKPGLYSDIRVSRQHRLRFKEFLLTREYLKFDRPTVNRLAVALRAIYWATYIAMIGSAVTVATVLWG